MTKQELFEILGIIEEVTATSSTENNSKNSKNNSNVDSTVTDDCLKLLLVKAVKTADSTTMYLYEGELCDKISLLVAIEKHESKGIRLETLNGVPGDFLKKKFKNSFLRAMHSKFVELQQS
jgi:hypothetical protein